MAFARNQARVEQSRYVGRIDRAIGNAPARRGDFDQRLQPDHAARTVAHELDGDAPPRGFLRHGCGHGIGPQGQRGGITGDENRHRHRSASSPSISASNFSGVT